jgi:hypothetical protein
MSRISLYYAHSDGMDDDSEPVHNNNSNHSSTNSSGMSQLQEATSSGDALTLEALTRGMQFRSDIATGESPVPLHNSYSQATLTSDTF